MARGRDPGFSVIVKLTDQFTKPIQNVNNKIAESTAKLRGIAAIPGAIARASGLDKIGGAFSNVGKSVLNLRNSITGMLGPLTRMGALIGGFALGKSITDAVTLGSSLVKLSKNTGVAIEDLQRLQYAANQSGSDTETFNGALLKLNKTIRDARKGNKDAVNVLQRAGVDMKALNAGTISTVDVFYKLADAVADTTDDVHKGALAVGAFGKSGAEFIAMLSEGSTGLRMLGADAAVMSDETAASSKKFGDTMLKMTQHVKDLAYSILERLLPGMTGTAEETDKWIAANKPDIIEQVVGVVDDLVEVFTAFGRIMRNDVLPAIRSLKPIWQAFEAVVGPGNAKLLLFATVVAPGVVGAILGIGKALIGLALAIAANPIGLAILALAAAFGVAAYAIYKDWDNIKRQTEATSTALTTTLRETKDNIAGLQWSDITDKFAEAWRDSIAATKATGARLVQTFQEVWTDIKAGWAEIDWGQMLGDAGRAMVSGFNAVKDLVVSAVTSPIKTIMAAWEKLVGWLGGIWDFWSGRAKTAGDVVPAMAGAGGGQPAAGGAWAAPYSGETRSASDIYGGAPNTAPGGAWAGVAQQTAKSEATININGLPPGSTVTQERSSGNTDLTVNASYAGQRAPAGTW